MRRIMTAAEVVGPIIGLIARMGFLSLGLVVRIPRLLSPPPPAGCTPRRIDLPYKGAGRDTQTG